MMQKVLKCLEHVPVAQVPGLRAVAIHDAVVAFGGSDNPRVLDCVKKLFAVMLRIFKMLLQQLAQLLDNVVFVRVNIRDHCHVI